MRGRCSRRRSENVRYSGPQSLDASIPGGHVAPRSRDARVAVTRVQVPSLVEFDLHRVYPRIVGPPLDDPATAPGLVVRDDEAGTGKCSLHRIDSLASRRARASARARIKADADCAPDMENETHGAFHFNVKLSPAPRMRSNLTWYCWKTRGFAPYQDR